MSLEFCTTTSTVYQPHTYTQTHTHAHVFFSEHTHTGRSSEQILRCCFGLLFTRFLLPSRVFLDGVLRPSSIAPASSPPLLLRPLLHCSCAVAFAPLALLLLFLSLPILLLLTRPHHPSSSASSASFPYLPRRRSSHTHHHAHCTSFTNGAPHHRRPGFSFSLALTQLVVYTNQRDSISFRPQVDTPKKNRRPPRERCIRVCMCVSVGSNLAFASRPA